MPLIACGLPYAAYGAGAAHCMHALDNFNMAVSAAATVFVIVSAFAILTVTIVFWHCLVQRRGPHRMSPFSPGENRTSPSLEAFRRHAGHLLTVIQDPDVLAWQLFSKHAISKTTVEEVCFPMVPPVQKKTCLLTAVSDHIAVNPAGLDTFLEVLKEQPYLMDIAQTLEETYAGELSQLHESDPLSVLMRLIIPSVDCRTHPVYTGGKPSPHKPTHLPSQNLLPPSQSSPIDIFASYLRSVYLRQKFPTYGKLPHSPSKKYTNLASVKKEAVSKEKADDFTRATICGDIDDVAEKKEKITMEEIAVVKEGVWPKCILIEGAPGIGKSTFSWEMCRKWGKGEILRDYRLVVLLSLREKKVREATCVSDLFQFYNRRVQEQVVQEITESGGRGVLLLFEGYDELPIDLRTKNSLFLDIIRGKELPEATVLITSHPSASGFLYEECKDYLTQHIEILGFTSENVQSYVESTCGSEPSLLSGIQKYLRCYPHIRTMMYVPLNAAIVVEVYRTSKKDQCDIPKTKTQLYNCLVCSLLRRYLNDHPVYGNQQWRIRTFDDLPPDVYNQLCKLGEIAYKGIANGQQVIFDDLPKSFDTLGLMQCVPELYVNEGAAVSHSFLHLTIQEFMAAFHLSQLPLEEQVEQFEDEAPNQGMIHGFLAGLTGLAGIPIGNSDMDEGELFLDKVHWIFEAQKSSDIVNPSKITFIGSYSKTNVFDCYVLGYCISHGNCTWEIDLKYCSIGDKEVEGLVQGTLEHPTRFQGAISVLNLGNNTVTSEGVKFLLGLPKHMFTSSLKRLELANNPIGSGGSVSLFRTLSALNYLDLFGTGIGVEDCRALSKLLSSSSALESLHISGNDLPPEAVKLIASGLQQNTGLKELAIGGSQLSLEHCIALASALSTNCTVHTLDISNCCIGPEGAGHLAVALGEDSTLQVLRMGDNPIGVAGATALAQTLALNKSLQMFNISNCEIDCEGAQHLAGALHKNCTLQVLNMSDNIGVAGATALAEALTFNKSLQELNLRDDSIGVEGTEKLLNSLTQNTTLETLGLPWKYKDVISSDAYNALRTRAHL